MIEMIDRIAMITAHERHGRLSNVNCRL